MKKKYIGIVTLTLVIFSGCSTMEVQGTLLKSPAPPVQLIIGNDGDAPILDKKVDIPTYSGSGTTPTINITFTIYGIGINDERKAYYGDDSGEDWRNISVTGDILYPQDENTLDWQTKGTWIAHVTPAIPGGTITIAIDWPGSGSASQTIDIINGTYITASVDSFTIGEETTLTFIVKDIEDFPVKYAEITLMWKSDASMKGTWLNATTGDNTAGNGLNGEYSFIITTDDQGNVAPRYMTITANDTGSGYHGVTKVLMENNHTNLTISAICGNEDGTFLVAVKNNGSETIENVYLDVSARFGLLNRRMSFGSFEESFPANLGHIFTSPRIFGFGKISVQVDVTHRVGDLVYIDDFKTANGYIFFHNIIIQDLVNTTSL